MKISKTPFIHLILLAAGSSKRMKSIEAHKGLLVFNKNFWILEQIHRFSKLKNSSITLVLGKDINLYEKKINFKNLGSIKVLHNKSYHLGQFSSICLAAKNFFNTFKYQNSESKIFISPIDVPIPDTDVLNLLIQSSSDNTTSYIPTYNDHGGHPVLISYDHLIKLSKIPEKLYSIYRFDKFLYSYSNRVKRIKVNDEQVIINLNTPEQWINYKQKYCEENFENTSY